MLSTRPVFVTGVLLTAALLTTSLATAASAAVTAAPWGYLVSADGKTRLPLDKPEIVVGSAPSCGAIISHRTIAKKQVILRYSKGIVTIRGLRTKFPTLVAGTLLRRGRTLQLFKRTLLTFGAATWTFEWGDRGKIIPPQRKSTTAPKHARKPSPRGKRPSATPRAKAKSTRRPLKAR